MGATIDLYRLSDAKLCSKGIRFMSNKQVQNLSNEEFEKYWDNYNVDCWEDGNEHYLIDISYYRSCYRKYYRAWRRQEAKLNRLLIQRDIIDYTGNIKKYITADNIACYSGSVLNHRYFRKNFWFTVCTSKEKVIKFFKKYGNKWCKSTVDDILNKWDNKSFLIINY